jgi:hypothetical protein
MANLAGELRSVLVNRLQVSNSGFREHKSSMRAIRAESFEVRKTFCEVWDHSPTHRHHLTLTRISVIADDRLSCCRCDVIVRRGFQGNIRELSDTKGILEFLLSGLCLQRRPRSGCFGNTSGLLDQLRLRSGKYIEGESVDPAGCRTNANR